MYKAIETAKHPANDKPAGGLFANRSRLLASLLALAVVGVVGFAAGVQYQKHEDSENVSFTTRGGRFTTMMGGRRATMGVFGSVTAVSADSITIKDHIGNQSKTFSIASSTTITDNGSSAKASDIQTGDEVRVEASTSNSRQASRIILDPSANMGPGSGAPIH